jgi:cold-inducible RNA-binding protein
LNIYVGNLSFDTSERELEAAFAAYGSVTSARIATDRDTNRPRGFGFVEMGNQTEAEAAIAALNGRELQGRTLTVNEARPREERGAGGGGNRRGGGGYGGGGGGNRW